VVRRDADLAVGSLDRVGRGGRRSGALVDGEPLGVLEELDDVLDDRNRGEPRVLCDFGRVPGQARALPDELLDALLGRRAADGPERDGLGGRALLPTHGPDAKKSHKDVEATIIHHSNTYTNITASKAKTFWDGKQADILLSGIASIDNPAARNLHLDVTSTNPMGVTNQELINRAGLSHQPGPGEHDPRNDVLTSAKRAEERKHTKYDAICAATGSVLSPFKLETTGGHGLAPAGATATAWAALATQLDRVVYRHRRSRSSSLRRPRHHLRRRRARAAVRQSLQAA
jgi:hypothetical protein